MINLLVCGALGKMGNVVKAAVDKCDDLNVLAQVDIRADGNGECVASFDKLNEKCDCIIDFSHPSVLSDLIDYAVNTNTPAVICTTGLSEAQISQIHAAAKKVPIFFSANMSLGVNLLVSLCKKAAAFLENDFDIEIIEKHHNQKVDAPSGTALMLANAMNEQDKYEYTYDRQSVRKKRDKNEIGIHSVRGGNIVGEHEVIFAGHDECISLKHTATSKEVFATGAINAARFLYDKKPGLYSMEDIFK